VDRLSDAGEQIEMAATVRYTEQHCPIARALDELGDRWTLLIVRELVRGDQRFTDLREHLPGIAPTLLTQRLRTLIDQGLVATRELPPPAARSVYTITDRGRETVPVLRALARYGMPLLEPAAEGVVIAPEMVVDAALRAFYDDRRVVGVDERYVVRIDGREFRLSSVRGGGAGRDDVDATIDASAATWMDIRQGRLTIHDAIDAGRMRVDGSATALAHFADAFGLTLS
jgi:DNA-binding HxlR family transcriptional regulator